MRRRDFRQKCCYAANPESDTRDRGVTHHPHPLLPDIRPPLPMRPLRFGIMAPADGLTRFARTAIENITRDDLAEPVVLIVDQTIPKPSGIAQKLKKAVRFDGNLWHVQNKLFPLSEIEAYRVAPLTSHQLPRLVCEPTLKGKWSQYFKPEDIEQIRAFDLDFIVKFAFGIVRGEVLNVPRYGVWSWHHDDEEKYRGGPPAFWEIATGDPVSGVLLQRLTDRLDGGVILKKCYVPTDGSSYRNNLQRVQFSSTHMARWVCLDIHAGSADYLSAPPSKTTAPVFRAPDDLQMLKFWARLLGNAIRRKIANQRMDIWNAGVIRAAQSRFLDENYTPQIEWTEYRENRQFVADPFLLPVPGETRLLAEELNYFTEQGRIVEIGRGPEGKLSTIAPVFDEGVHMSYPYTFEFEGSVYAIPETSQANEIRLYQRNPDTGGWSRVKTLIEGIDAVDTTVFEYGGSWWLLHSRTQGTGPWSLYVWNAPSLFGLWKPHPGNPVKTDIGSSRPAGNPFRHEGQLYRPAQDGRISYGGAMTINRIDSLSMANYRESIVRRIHPDPKGPYPDGIHTLSGFGDSCVVDGKKHTWSPGLTIARAWAKIRGRPRIGEFAYSRMRPVDNSHVGKRR